MKYPYEYYYKEDVACAFDFTPWRYKDCVHPADRLAPNKRGLTELSMLLTELSKFSKLIHQICHSSWRWWG